MKNLKNDNICIGIIINTHGIRGELKVEPLTFDLDRISYLDEIMIGENLVTVLPESTRHDNRFIYLKLKGYDNINDVVSFKNKKVYIQESKRLKLPDNLFYQDHLIGKRVMDPQENFIGYVTDIIENPANSILVIKDDNENMAYIPFVRAFIKSIDKDIIIEPIEGMFL
ncbi:MAG: ribosome maturation factor RimM [Tissierellia bacterium]|nr:ribosome maturation factor RimM [Tissierellia bacterium]